MRENENIENYTSTFEANIPNGFKLLGKLPNSIKSLNEGIVILHAIWSGASILNIKRLLGELHNENLVIVDIYVVNLDTLTKEEINSLLKGNISHGNGEAVWVEDGSISEILLEKNKIEQFASYINDRIDKIETNIIRVINSFELTGIGLYVDLKHYQNGLLENTKLVDRNNSRNVWTIKGRVVSGLLFIADEETLFEKENQVFHTSMSFANEEKRMEAIETLKNQRQNKIFPYLLHSPKGLLKPNVGTELLIKEKDDNM